MANVVASILATLGLDARAFKAEIAAAETTVFNFGKGLTSMPGLAGFLGAAGLGVGIKGLIDYGAEVQHLSDRYQVTTDSIQKFGNAAEQNGVSMESVARAFGKLEKAQEQALQGSDEMAGSFVRLGVNVEDLKTLSPDQIMEKIGHSSMNAADLVKILGRNGLELRPILQGLADGTIEYGKAIDAIDIKQLEEADKTWKKLWETIRVGGAGVVSRLIGELKDAGNEASVFGQLFSKFFSAKNKDEAIASSKALFAALKADATNDAKFFEDQQKKKEDVGKKKTVTPEDVALEGKRAEKVEAAQGENAVLSAQLDHLDAIAKALQIHFEIQKKIAAAGDAITDAYREQLELQEKLSIQKIAQGVAEKNAEREKLTLKELAEAGPLAGAKQGYFTLDTLNARRALEEQALGEKARLAQRPEEAAFHLNLAEQIKASIPGLKDTEKDISGQVRMGNDTSSVFQQMIAKMDAILSIFSG